MEKNMIEFKNKSLDDNGEVVCNIKGKKEGINENLEGNNQYKDDQISNKDKETKEEFILGTKRTKLSAENILSELIANIRDKESKLGEKISDYKTECQTPLTDVLENDSKIIVRVDLPGVEREDISVHLIEKAIEIMAVFPGKGDPGSYIKRERNYGKIVRRVALSKKINEKAIKSTFKDCILTIELPKLFKDRYKISID